ncbi:MAG: hypothetical protein Q8T09_18885 [Candidatus Melainabacteria bacterium]|nr:hypothetical protein [Candidatus Melainabacteria bacterium]
MKATHTSPAVTKSKSAATKPETKITQSKSKSQNTSTKKSSPDPLSMCPVDGAGWCPYPFSVAQLKKRLKAKAQQS